MALAILLRMAVPRFAVMAMPRADLVAGVLLLSQGPTPRGVRFPAPVVLNLQSFLGLNVANDWNIKNQKKSVCAKRNMDAKIS